MGGIEVGDAATWVGAVFAAAAAYGALGTLKSQRQQIKEQRSFIETQTRVLELQRQELAGTLDDRAAAQARNVRVRFRVERVTEGAARDAQTGALVPARPYPGSAVAEQYVGHEARFFVFNRSDAPIYDVSVHLGDCEEGYRFPGEPSPEEVAELTRYRTREDVGTKPVIAAFGEDGFWSGLRWKPQWADDPYITFRDASEQWWTLDVQGGLTSTQSP